jgi:chromosome partitioning protein
MAIVVVASGKGGVGKTALVTNIFEKLGASAIIDTDVHGGSTTMDGLREDKIPFLVRAKTVAELVPLLEMDSTDRITLIDCGGFDDDLTRVALANADMIIAPTNESPIERAAINKLSGIIAMISEEVGREVRGHVLYCRFNQNKRKFDKLDAMIESLDNMTTLDVTIPSHQSVIAASEFGERVKSGVMPVKYDRLVSIIHNYLIETGAYKP